MSGWVSPTHPALSPIPLGALRGGDWAERRGEWAPASPQSGWCFVEASISRQSRKGYRWKDHADVGAIFWIQRELSCVILSSLTLVRNLKPPRRQ